MVGQLLILLLVLLLIPFVIGGLITEAEGHDGKLLFRWVSGQFLLWAGFQLLCVPLILRERSFGSLVAAFWGYIAALLLLAAASRFFVMGVTLVEEKKVCCLVLPKQIQKIAVYGPDTLGGFLEHSAFSAGAGCAYGLCGWR